MKTPTPPIAIIQSAALTGFHGTPIEVEVSIKAGLPGLQIVGMGNKAIDEARQRVRTAITNSLLSFPAKKVTINLAPAELPKDGTHLDLPIALGILVASRQLQQSQIKKAVFAGELALDGRLRPIRGATVIAEVARQNGATRLFVPIENLPQAQLVTGIEIIGVTHLQQLFQQLTGAIPFKDPPKITPETPSRSPHPTLDTIVGQQQAKRALIIAAAGRHNLLLSGAPGTGKTLLAKALPSLLPPLSKQEVLEVTKLHSLSLAVPIIHYQPPLRSPHHSITLTALIGGGLHPRPGDISLAHKGVLFLDELPEYPRATLEALRQPLEDRSITLSRLYGAITYPADILLVATMNPCPCGYYGDTATPCGCSALQISRYQKKLSGPLLDRIDLRVTVSRISHEHFFDTKMMQENQHSKVIKLVLNARELQKIRYNRSDFYNGYASLQQAKELFKTTTKAHLLLTQAAHKLRFSNRTSLRVLRVARTIADLAASPTIEQEHIAEALQFR